MLNVEYRTSNQILIADLMSYWQLNTQLLSVDNAMQQQQRVSIE